MTQAHILISGSVQGVGFRYFIRSQAKKIGLKGWVKNLPDGRVEALVQGSEEKLDHLIKISKKGPVLAQVQNVQVVWEEPVIILSDFLIAK